MRSSVRVACVVSVLLASGCAGTPSKPAPPSADALGGPEVDALYQQASQLAERIRSAPAPSVEDGVPVGERPSALAELRTLADRCTTTPGCRIGKLLDLYAGLLLDVPDVADEDTELLGEAGEDVAESASPVVADVPEAARSVNLLNGRELGDVIALNGPVKAALNEWLTWMRPNLIEAYENYQYLRHEMWPEYQKAGLPEALLFGILAKESGGKVHAVSRAGAAGLFQFMPATGRRLGLGQDRNGFDTRFDPARSAHANVAYLNERFAEFNHDLALALAAYNGGEGRMLRIVRRTGHNNFWDPSVRGALPPETRDYVPMVLAAAWLFLHPDRYGVEFPVVDMEPATLTLEQPTSLNALTICLGNAGTRNGWFRPLRNLNPRWLPQQQLPAGTELAVPAAVLTPYRERCLSGETAALAAEIAGAAKRFPTQVASTPRTYRVRSGDSLATIARRHHCGSPQSLARANGIKAPKYLIRPGQVLRLDGCRG